MDGTVVAHPPKKRNFACIFRSDSIPLYVHLTRVSLVAHSHKRFSTSLVVSAFFRAREPFPNVHSNFIVTHANHSLFRSQHDNNNNSCTVNRPTKTNCQQKTTEILPYTPTWGGCFSKSMFKYVSLYIWGVVVAIAAGVAASVAAFRAHRFVVVHFHMFN